MLISPIRLTELISFCDSGVLAFDVFVSDVPNVDCGGGRLVYSKSQQHVEYSD